MTRVLVVGAGTHNLGRAIASALSDLAVKVVVACEQPINGLTFADMAYCSDHRRTAQYKKALRDQAKYNEAGIQQRRKTLTKFHAEKRARMAHKQATKRRNRFV